MKKKLFSLFLLLGVVLCMFFSGCKKAPEIVIEKRDKVTLSYDSYLQDGEILEEGINKTIVIGRKDSFPVFDKELLGMKVGEQKNFTTKNPSDGYGIFYDDLKIQEISSTLVNTIGTMPKAGDQINLGGLKGVVLDVYPTTVKIDFNDRQTRENVQFHVKILSIEKNAAKE